jgi:hypothetical protein
MREKRPARSPAGGRACAAFHNEKVRGVKAKKAKRVQCDAFENRFHYGTGTGAEDNRCQVRQRT